MLIYLKEIADLKNNYIVPIHSFPDKLLISDVSDFELKIDMKNSLQKSFLITLVDFKFKLPNIKSIEISKIGTKDTDVNDFFATLISLKTCKYTYWEII